MHYGLYNFMLPQSHVAYTLATLSEIQKRTGAFADADYRLVALAAVAPDLIDKPLAVAYYYPKYKSAVLFAHTMLAHLVVLTTIGGKFPNQLVYALAFNGHALLDRLWLFHDTWYWPLRGWRFHVWRKRGSEQEDIKLAYWYAFTRRPELWGWEVGGVVAFIWFVFSNRLWERERLITLLKTGRIQTL
jgi:hypothetical protein